MVKKYKLLYVVTEDWYFCTHRLPLAFAAKEAGFEVAVATRISRHEAIIQAAGITVIPLRRMSRSSLNILNELASIFELFMIYKRERPAIVHQVALKPVIYGSVAAWLLKVQGRVCALGGLGFVFSSNTKKAKLLNHFVVALFRLFISNAHTRVIVQNEYDFRTLVENAKIETKNMRLIPGAGVNLCEYVVRPISRGVPIAMLASRMLWDKGVGVFKDAAKLLHSEGIRARFVLVGEPDLENPSSLTRAKLMEWHEEGTIEWWGYKENMPEILSEARVVCLPTFYGEGVPKVLIEAMACGRPIVTTDMPGTRDLVSDSRNGILVRPRDSKGLAEALKILLLDSARCSVMGEEGRRVVEEGYALQRVVGETLSIYQELVN